MASDSKALIEGMCQAGKWLEKIDSYLEREYSRDLTLAEMSGLLVVRKLLEHCMTILVSGALKHLLEHAELPPTGRI